MINFSKEFKDKYFKKYEEELNFLKLSKKKDELEEKANLMISAKNFEKSKNSFSPLILGNAVFRISITSIGTFPPYKVTENYIYPINFCSKKRFKPHKKTARENKEKMMYKNFITEKGFKIVSEDKVEWSGENFWNEFVADVGGTGEIKSFEEFSGLSHPTTIKLIEKLGNISNYKNYIPFIKR